VSQGIAHDLRALGVNEAQISAWAATAAPVLASEARSIEHHVLKAAGKVASKVTEISAVAEEAGAPNAAQISQVLAGILAATGLVGKGGGGAVRTW